jgi:hypothetical protein
MSRSSQDQRNGKRQATAAPDILATEFRIRAGAIRSVFHRKATLPFAWNLGLFRKDETSFGALIISFSCAQTAATLLPVQH